MSKYDRIVMTVVALVLLSSPAWIGSVFGQQQNFPGVSTAGANTFTGTQTFNTIGNGTGVQLFNTTTTCTTAATISTPCTTAAITLPVAYADTNYRIVCNGLGAVTAFPQIQTITKSNTTFTITLNNLTAAAASYTSFDCIAMHN